MSSVAAVVGESLIFSLTFSGHRCLHPNAQSQEGGSGRQRHHRRALDPSTGKGIANQPEGPGTVSDRDRLNIHDVDLPLYTVDMPIRQEQLVISVYVHRYVMPEYDMDI